jgi:hypothetical protein
VTEVPAPIQKAMKEQTLVEDHRTGKEGEIAPLDASYPTMRVFSDSKKKQTHNRMSAMHESTYQEDVMNETYQEDVMNKTYRENRMSAMHKSIYLEGVKYETYRVNRNCAKNVMMTAPHHPRDRQTDTTGPALMARTCTKTRGQRRSR